MNLSALATGVLRATAQRVTAVDRLEGVRSMWTGGRGAGSTGWVILLLLICLALAGVLVYFQVRRRREWQAFLNAGEQAGLSTEQLKLLRHMAGLVKTKTPTDLYSSENAFQHAVTQLVQSRQVTAMSAKMRATLIAQVESMRERLGFRMPAQPSETLVSSRQMAVGSTVYVTAPDAAEAVRATVVEVGRDEFAIEAEVPLDCQPGDECVVRHSVGWAAWEFNTQVVRSSGEGTVLNHSQKGRLINRRRFPRVRIDRPAQVARFPFLLHDPERDTPEFVTTRLVEIGGTGFLVGDSSLAAQVGDKALVTARLTDRLLVQGLARVRRKAADHGGESVLALELIDLEADEMAELVRQTNQAAVQKAQSPLGRVPVR